MNDVIERADRARSRAHDAMFNFVAADLEMAWTFARIAMRRDEIEERQRAIVAAQKALLTAQRGIQRLSLSEDERDYLREALTRVADVLRKLLVFERANIPAMPPPRVLINAT